MSFAKSHQPGGKGNTAVGEMQKMAHGKANSKGDGAWKSGYMPQGGTPTQEADFISLLAARVREQVEEMDIDIAIHALMQTHDETTLKAAMLDPMQARGIHLRQML